MTPTLESDRLILRPYTFDLVSSRHINWLNDKVVTRFSEQRHRHHTLSSQLDYVGNFPEGSHLWLICMKPDAPFPDIGSLSAHIDHNNLIANMGIMIGETSVWSSGYGLEAWTCAMNHLLGHDIRKIEAGCMEGNVGMETIFRRSGMICEAIIPDHFWDGAEPKDKLCYGRIK